MKFHGSIEELKRKQTGSHPASLNQKGTISSSRIRELELQIGSQEVSVNE